MYSIKEKNKYLRDLHATQHATSDLDLLEKLDPRNDQIPTLRLAPNRHSERILYILLDVATAEQIRENRRATQIEKEKAEAKKAESGKEKEIEKQLSDLERKVEEAKSDPEDEKKSPQQSKSASPEIGKKKTSSQKSNGKTLQTKTSK